MKTGKPVLALLCRDEQLFPQAGMLAAGISQCSWKAASRVALAVTEEHTVSRQVCSAPGFLALFSHKSQSQNISNKKFVLLCFSREEEQGTKGELIWPRLIHRALPQSSMLFIELFSLCSHHMRCSQRGNLISAQTPHTGAKIHLPRHGLQRKHGEGHALEARGWLPSWLNATNSQGGQLWKDDQDTSEV